MIDLTPVWSAIQGNIVPFATGVISALGGRSLIVKSVFNHASRVFHIEDNAHAIAETARNHIFLRNLLPNSPYKGAPQLVDPNKGMGDISSYMSSILSEKIKIKSMIYADPLGLFVYVRDSSDDKDPKVRTRYLPLHENGFSVIFDWNKQHLSQPDCFLKNIKTPPSIKDIDEGVIKESRRANRWAAPSTWRRGIARFNGNNMQEKIDGVVNALRLNALTLAADDSDDLALFGTCHVALKRTDDNGDIHLIVMPLNSREAAKIKKISREGLAEGQTLSAKTITDILSGCSKDYCEICSLADPSSAPR